jgi:hypothetical protein
VGDGADRAVADEVEEGGRLRVEAVHERLDERQPGLAGGVDERHRRAVVRRQWLLAEHGLAGPECCEDERCVPGVHGRDVDGVDARVGEDLVVGARGDVGETVLGGFVREGLGPLEGRAAGGDESAAARGQLREEATGDAARAEDRPAGGRVVRGGCGGRGLR